MSESRRNLLEINNLSIQFKHNKRDSRVVNHLNLKVKEGEILGIVGESGSGKSMTAHSILRLLPEEAVVSSGEILFLGQDIMKASKKELQAIRGNKIAMIFQEPMTSLNPLMVVGRQIEEMLRHHERLSEDLYKKRTLEAMEDAGLSDGEALYRKYPHELSGGMRQRVMIAMAMITKPKLLIADEPTTALDVSIQQMILDLLRKLNQKYGITIIFISHDLSVIRYLCSRAMVMKAGNTVEIGEVEQLFSHPRSLETKKLVEARPSFWYAKNSQRIAELGEDNKKAGKAILIMEDVSIFYKEKQKGFFSKKVYKPVVKKVGFTLLEGETVGLVGESGSGKSTLAKAITGLVSNVTGRIVFSNQKEQPQMVFQDPYNSLNPMKKVAWILEEPLKIQTRLSKEEREERVSNILLEVGLEKEHLTRYVSELSGGQRQRVAIAVALMLNPRFLILDEPVSALDVTIQEQILELLMELKRKHDLTYLFISHDLNVIHQVCDRVFVMQEGQLVESGRTNEVFTNPSQEYTKKLLIASTLGKVMT